MPQRPTTDAVRIPRIASAAPTHCTICGQKPVSTDSASLIRLVRCSGSSSARASCWSSTSTTVAPVVQTSALVNFWRPMRCSTGSIASRRYALKAQPKSEIGVA